VTLLPGPTKILCVGLNYVEHAREVGIRPPEEPLVFLKPPSSLVGDGEPVVIPSGVGQVDYEGEIAFRVGRRARRVPESEALSVLSHVLPLNDVTARDLQKKDHQWTRAKGFDTFCPVGEAVPLDAVPGGIAGLRVETRVNGQLRQADGVEGFIYPLPYLVAWVTRIMTLEEGDLLATGTPSGIGPLQPGDEVVVTIPGVGSVRSPVRGEEGP
jgi:2-keto-4-pentenoate hydratase/2-oxohepta-3-ene-1,7-dioic acid hydratase in catechol pathway